MSRNFEVLQRLTTQSDPFTADAATTAAANGAAARKSAPQAIVGQCPTPSAELGGLVRRLFLHSGERKFRAVGFSDVQSSGNPAEICAQVAVLLASAVDVPVAVVDADIGSPQLHKLFATAEAPGLVEAASGAAGPAEYIKHVADNLWFVPAGCLKADAHSEFVRIRAHIAALKKEFEYLLVNLPPALDDDGSALVSHDLDGAVLIVDAESTRRDAALRARMMFEQVQTSVLGAVLLNRTFPIPKTIYKWL